MIRRYFNTTEIIQLLTSNFYSRLYYGAEIWQIPGLNRNAKKQLYSASAGALKLCEKIYDPSCSYIDLHKKFKRALPNKFTLYRHGLLLYKLFNNMIPRKDWVDLNFQITNTSRQTLFEIRNDSNFKVGNNILCNRLSCLNKKIELNMLNIPLNSYKIMCKEMFLSWVICSIKEIVFNFTSIINFQFSVCSFYNNVYSFKKEQINYFKIKSKFDK